MPPGLDRMRFASTQPCYGLYLYLHGGAFVRKNRERDAATLRHAVDWYHEVGARPWIILYPEGVLAGWLEQQLGGQCWRCADCLAAGGPMRNSQCWACADWLTAGGPMRNSQCWACADWLTAGGPMRNGQCWACADWLAAGGPMRNGQCGNGISVAGWQ
jgi:hypothetical protein